MGLFGGNNEDSKNRRNPDAVFGFRVLAAGYMLYMLYDMVQLYLSGESDDIWILVAGIAVLGGGGLFVLISSYLRWRKEKAAMEEEENENKTEELEEADSEEPEEE